MNTRGVTGAADLFKWFLFPLARLSIIYNIMGITGHSGPDSLSLSLFLFCIHPPYSGSISFRAQSLIVRSWLPDTIHRPSRDMSTELMGAVCDSSELMSE